MKIAWFTPFSKKSAVGKYSQIVTNEISKHHEVDLWIPSNTNILQSSLRKYSISFEKEKINFLQKYDIIVYNLGDHFFLHKDIYLMSQKIKGIVILHDYVMHHFFTGYYFKYLNDYEKYIQKMNLLYGKDGKKIAKESIIGKCEPIWDSSKVIDFPFYEQAINNSYGVIVHSSFAKYRIKVNYKGPILVINHPVFKEKYILQNNAKKILNLPKNKKILLTVGNINANKQIDLVLETLGKNYMLSSQYFYVILGHSEEKSKYLFYLKKLVKKYHLEKNVRFLGYQENKMLHSYLSAANVFINLRNPVMETASWSVLEQMLYKKPIIVTNLGFYSELNNNCVLKVNPLSQQVDLIKKLELLNSNDKLGHLYGESAYEYVKSNFTSAKYAKNIDDFFVKIISLKPGYMLIDKVSDELKKMATNVEVIKLNDISILLNQML